MLVASLLTHVVAPPAGAQSDTSQRAVRPRSMYDDLQLFSQVLNQIRVNHPDSVSMHALISAAIVGMVRAADPHSYVIPATRLQLGREADLRAGRLVPLPLEFVFVGGTPVIARVAAGSRATQQDLLPGDELVSIDGRGVLAESGVELDITLAGPNGSEATLGLERRRLDGSIARLTRTVQRERIDEATAVPVAHMLDSVTGYVRVTTFMGARVADDLNDALRRLESLGMSRLVLDLRDNGGGSVAEAATVSGQFLPKGAIVYTTTGAKRELTDTGRVARSFWQSERRYPIVVMINAGTASASELVAGALQDHDRAIIVGRPSFGKSLLMRGFPLADGSSLMLVVGTVHTPCGRVVQREYRGITRRDYYRLAAAERDTVGRASCQTSGGRRVFGGGGIYPDVLWPEAAGTPAWVTRLTEEAVPLAWVGGWVSENRSTLVSLDAFVSSAGPADSALAGFRAFAARMGVTIPAGTDSDSRLRRLLTMSIASAAWGQAGWYRASMVADAEIRAAVNAFNSVNTPR